MNINRIIDTVMYHASKKEQAYFKELCEKNEAVDIDRIKPKLKKLLFKIRCKYWLKVSILISTLIIIWRMT